MDEIRLRTASAQDAGAILDIYRPIVLRTAISFEFDPPTIQEMERRIVAVTARYPWIVATASGAIAGYAYATEFRKREAYDFTAESTVYVHPDQQGRGVGRALMTELANQLHKRGFRTLVAGVALPNGASQALHSSLGFVRAGTIPRAGRKFDRWHDIEFWTLDLDP